VEQGLAAERYQANRAALPESAVQLIADALDAADTGRVAAGEKEDPGTVGGSDGSIPRA